MAKEQKIEKSRTLRHMRHLVIRIYRLLRMIFNTLVIKPVQELGSPVMRTVVSLLQVGFFTVKHMIKNRTNTRTASLSFYSLLSIVPISAIVFAAANALGYIDLLVDNLYSIFPQSPEIIDYVVDFADKTLEKTRGGVMAITAGLITLWTALSMLDELVEAINDTWHVELQHNIFKRYAIYFGILIFLPAIWIGGEALGIYFSNLFGLGNGIIFNVLAWIMKIGVELMIFTLFYKIVPNTRVEWRTAIVAGLTAGTVFYLFHIFFTYILVGMTSYNAIYGSFAALPLFLFWLRYSWQILLSGNELAYSYQNLNLLKQERKEERLKSQQQ
ncbi:MAG: YihY/virulence factor BrkB family protein [Alistipes sp.]|nr:YihY/virulence factor BrkB family protein [Alistipes sp.]